MLDGREEGLSSEGDAGDFIQLASELGSDCDDEGGLISNGNAGEGSTCSGDINGPATALQEFTGRSRGESCGYAKVYADQTTCSGQDMHGAESDLGKLG